MAELLHIVDIEPGIFRSPLIKSGIRDAVFPAELLNSNARLGILQYRYHLLLRVTLPCHDLLPWASSQHSRTSEPMV